MLIEGRPYPEGIAHRVADDRSLVRVAALCRRNGPDSMYFLALSHRPPALFIRSPAEAR